MINIYTAYAEANDMTFIVERITAKQKIIERVIGWYYGKPDKEKTAKFSYEDLTHIFQADGTCGSPVGG